MVLREARTPPELACRAVASVRASSAAVTVRIAAVTSTVVRATVTLPMPIAVFGVALITMTAAPFEAPRPTASV
jgi:hypothetical protein